MGLKANHISGVKVVMENYQQMKDPKWQPLANRARKVSTFCNECADQPYLCLPCFSEKHS